jgi:hypothetical protein
MSGPSAGETIDAFMSRASRVIKPEMFEAASAKMEAGYDLRIRRVKGADDSASAAIERTMARPARQRAHVVRFRHQGCGSGCTVHPLPSRSLPRHQSGAGRSHSVRRPRRRAPHLDVWDMRSHPVRAAAEHSLHGARRTSCSATIDPSAEQLIEQRRRLPRSGFTARCCASWHSLGTPGGSPSASFIDRMWNGFKGAQHVNRFQELCVPPCPARWTVIIATRYVK